jgi:hypothetical protein
MTSKTVKDGITALRSALRSANAEYSLDGLFDSTQSTAESPQRSTAASPPRSTDKAIDCHHSRNNDYDDDDRTTDSQILGKRPQPAHADDEDSQLFRSQAGALEITAEDLDSFTVTLKPAERTDSLILTSKYIVKSTDGRVVPAHSQRWLEVIAYRTLEITEDQMENWIDKYNRRSRVVEHLFSGCKGIAAAAAQSYKEAHERAVQLRKTVRYEERKSNAAVAAACRAAFKKLKINTNKCSVFSSDRKSGVPDDTRLYKIDPSNYMDVRDPFTGKLSFMLLISHSDLIILLLSL